MEFHILGPLEVVEDGHSLAVAAGKQRALLAILLLRANEVVSTDELIDGLWGDRPPATASKSIQIYISQLRKVIGNGVLRTRPPGYELVLEEGELDLQRFEQLLEKGKSALASGRPKEAANELREALSLWRGAPLADFTYEPFAQAQIARLEELHLNALEERNDADLALGHHADLIAELEALVSQHPLRERLRGQLMLALYRCGRQAEALEVYQQTRRLLRDELGLEPGPALQELQQAILRQDPALGPPSRDLFRGLSTGARRRPHRLIVAGALFLAAAIAAALFEVSRDSGTAAHLQVAPNALGAIDPKTNQVVAQVGVGTQPAGIVYGYGSLWIANQVDGTVTSVDPQTLRRTRTIPVGGTPSGLAVGVSSIWVATDKGVKLIDPTYKVVTRTLKIPVRAASRGYPFPLLPFTVALSSDTAWISTTTGGFGGTLVRADPRTGHPVESLDIGAGPAAMTASSAGVWVADRFDNKVTHIDSTGAVTDTIPLGHSPTGVAAGFGSIWVAEGDVDDVKRIDPISGSVETTIPVGRHPVGVAVADGSVWVANEYSGTVSRIDPDSNDVFKTIKVGGGPVGIAVSPGRVWVTVQANYITVGTNEGGGGVLRIDGRPDVDPALSNYNFDAVQMNYATCAQLLNYPDKPAPEGSRLSPEVARSMPRVSADLKTYTYTLRPGYRFSPPSNERVTAKTFKYTIERVLNPKLETPVRISGYLDDIVGARAYERRKARHISGVIAHGNKLIIKLTRPIGDLPARMNFFCPVPTTTPLDSKGSPIPSAGPYYVASALPGQVILKRNPNYHGPRPRRLREIVYDGTGLPGRAVDRVNSGELDYAWNYFPSYAARLERRYGSAAKAGRRRFFVDPIWAVDAYFLNTSRPLFSNRRMRQAVNYAIDRRALAQAGGFFMTSGRLGSFPTDQYLPSVEPGFKDVSIYPFRPDLARARKLAGRVVHRVAVLYTCNEAPCPEEAHIIKRNLAPLGITVEVREFSGGELSVRFGKPREPYDLFLSTWATDYPDPYNTLNTMFDGNLARRGQGYNASHFDEPAYNRKLEAAARLSGDARYRTYGRLDADLSRNAAPLLVFANETRRDFFSARVGCQIYQPVIGMDLGALCIRD